MIKIISSLVFKQTVDVGVLLFSDLINSVIDYFHVSVLTLSRFPSVFSRSCFFVFLLHNFLILHYHDTNLQPYLESNIFFNFTAVFSFL